MAGIRVAIVPSHGLGDGLIQLVLANNLCLNGCDVTYFHDYMAQMAEYVEGIRVLSMPPRDAAVAAFREAHIVLYDIDSRFSRSMPADTATWLAGNGICYSMTHTAPRAPVIAAAELRRRLPAGHRHDAEGFLRLNRSLRDTGACWRRKPIARQLADNAGDLLRLERRTYSNGVRVPGPGAVRSAGAAVAIHPTSSHPGKSWDADRFVQLARLLRRDGWRPVFTVSPQERPEWTRIADGFEVPSFQSVKALADYYRRAQAFIGNDSGNAHLASCLELPNLVIHRHWRSDSPWRPGWKEPRVVSSRALSRADWQKSISVERVYRAFSSMAEAQGAPLSRSGHANAIDTLRTGMGANTQ